MFVIKLVERLANGMPVDSFNQTDISYFREELAVNLWKWSSQFLGGKLKLVPLPL